MLFTFISDVHGNVDVLRWFLATLPPEPPRILISLGDIGSNDCYDLLRTAGAISTFGNYEVSGYRDLSPENLAYVLAMPPLLSINGFIAAHAVPAYPPNLLNVADFQTYLQKSGESWRRIFQYPNEYNDSFWKIYAELHTRGKNLFFHGHTHRQEIWKFSPENRPRKVEKKRLTLNPDATYIVGVGSLGRPENGLLPGYVEFDEESREISLMTLRM